MLSMRSAGLYVFAFVLLVVLPVGIGTWRGFARARRGGIGERNPGPEGGYGLCAWSLRHMPGWFNRTGMDIGAWIAWATLPWQRAYSREYLALALGREPTARDVWRHFRAYTEYFIQRLRICLGNEPDIRFAAGEGGELRAWIDQGRAALYGTMHVGHSDLLGFLMSNLGGRVHMVRKKVGNSDDVGWLAKRYRGGVSFIWINDWSRLILAMNDALRAGCSLAMQCDRPEYSSKLEGFDFLGARRLFPFTIYHLGDHARAAGGDVLRGGGGGKPGNGGRPHAADVPPAPRPRTPGGEFPRRARAFPGVPVAGRTAVAAHALRVVQFHPDESPRHRRQKRPHPPAAHGADGGSGSRAMKHRSLAHAVADNARAAFGFGCYGVIALAVIPVCWLVAVFLRGERRKFACQRIVHLGLAWWERIMEGIGVFTVDFPEIDAVRALRGTIIAPSPHPSLIDAPHFLARMPRLTCLMKKSVLKNPFMGSSAALAGYLPNDHGREFIRVGRDALRAGENLLIFPEGTRTVRGPGEPVQDGVCAHGHAGGCAGADGVHRHAGAVPGQTLETVENARVPGADHDAVGKAVPRRAGAGRACLRRGDRGVFPRDAG